MIRRREFLGLAVASAAFAPSALAQGVPHKRMGFLYQNAETDPSFNARRGDFWSGISKHGWNETNLVADYRFLANTAAVAEQLGDELVALKPDVLIACTGQPALALSRLTQNIPIVFALVNGANLANVPAIQSFAHPGGNITGFLIYPDSEVYGKNLELVRELTPGLSRVAVIYNPTSAAGGETAFLNNYRDLAAKQNVEIVPLPVGSPNEIAAAVAKVAADPSLGLIVNGDAYMGANRLTAIAAVTQQRLKAVWSASSIFVNDGGLISYATDPAPLFQGAGDYAGLILNGVKTGDLPIQVPTKPMSLTVNLKTAKALDITIPASIIARADQVIE